MEEQNTGAYKTTPFALYGQPTNRKSYYFPYIAL